MKVKTKNAEVDFSFEIGFMRSSAQISLIGVTSRGTMEVQFKLPMNQTQVENAFLRSYEDIADELERLLKEKENSKGWIDLEELLKKAIYNTLGEPWEPADTEDYPEDYDPLWKLKSEKILQLLSDAGRKPILGG